LRQRVFEGFRNLILIGEIMEKQYGTGIKVVGILILASLLLWIASFVYAYYRDEVSRPAASTQANPGP